MKRSGVAYSCSYALLLVVKTSNQMLNDNEVDARQEDREEETGLEV